MPDKPLHFRDLKRILSSFGIVEDTKRGKGSHVVFWNPVTNRVHSIKHHARNPEIPKRVVQELRKKFELKSEDGIEHDDFYSRA